jgi:hypothetical protein
MRAVQAAVVFLGAFLLFLVEPLVAKMLLPVFGGSAAVWLAALLFFQLALLAGYGWADWLARRAPGRMRAPIHLALLALSCALLPIGLRLRALAALLPPTAQVLALLLASVGLPCFVLATTGPLLQTLWKGAQPYRLYALSNAGSMLGLLAYPAILEPALGTRAQSMAWSAAFVLFAALCAAAIFRTAPQGPAQETEVAPAPRRNEILWIALPLCASALLSAVTSDVTVNIAPVPLLWVLPLAAYLLSFVVTFQSDRIYQRRIFLPLFVFAIAFFAWRFRNPLPGEHIAREIGLRIAAFFACAVALHGETARIKPAPRHLTRFYLHLAAGGALGGAFVAVIAPLLFSSDFDLGVILVAAAAAISAALWTARPAARVAMALGVLFTAGRAVQSEARLRRDAIDFARDFYGAIRVQNEPERDGWVRALVHGTTEHGAQWLSAARAMEPTAYYGHRAGVGLVLDALKKEGRPLRVGIVGLGAGVLAAYCRPGDEYVFYEIDPLIEQIASRHFTFLRACAGARVVPGDARLTLAARPAQQYDLLVVDAFSGDAVPVHLLTVEGVALFAFHLRPGGLLAFHVSNLYLELEPIVAASAAPLRLPALAISDDGDSAAHLFPSTWVIAGDSSRLAIPGLERVVIPPGLRTWTDDYSNVLAQIALQ